MILQTVFTMLLYKHLNILPAHCVSADSPFIQESVQPLERPPCPLCLSRQSIYTRVSTTTGMSSPPIVSQQTVHLYKSQYNHWNILPVHCVSADSPFIQESVQPLEHPPCPLCLNRQSIYIKVCTTTGTPSLPIVSQQTVHLYKSQYNHWNILPVHCVSADSPFIQESVQPLEHPPCPLCLRRQSIYTRVSTTTGTSSLSIVSQQTVHLYKSQYNHWNILPVHCVSADSPFIQESVQPLEHPPCPLCLSRQSIYTRVSTTTGTSSLSIVSQQTVHLYTWEAEELLLHN